MAQIVDSWGITWYVTDFNLKYDVEKPAVLNATVGIPDGDITDDDLWLLNTALGQQYVYAMAEFNEELYIGTRDDTIGGKIFRYVDDDYWVESYDGELEKLNVNCFCVLGSYLYFGSASSGKIYRTSDGTNWKYVYGGDGEKVNCMTTHTYSATTYLYASIGSKVYRTSTGTAYTEVAGAYFQQMSITSMVEFNSKIWAAAAANPWGIWYSSDNGSTWTLRSMTYQAYYGFIFVFSSNLICVGSKVYANSGRITKISTSDVETVIYADNGVGNITNGRAYVTFDSVALIAMDNGKIYQTNGSTASLFYDIGGAGYGNPMSLIVSTDLYVGTTTYQVLKCTTSAHVWSVSETLTIRDINCLISWSSSFYTGGGSGGNDGKVYKASVITNLDATAVYGTPQSQIRSLYEWGDYLYAGTGTGGKILRTMNGSSWELVYDSASQYIYGFAVLGSTLYALGSNNAYVYSTTDGVTWTTAYNAGMTYAYGIDAANLTGTNYLYATFFDASSNCYIKRSSDGTTWSNVKTGSGYYFLYIKNMNGTSLMASTNNSLIYYSTDGTTWSSVAIGSGYIYYLDYYNLCAYAVGSDGKVYKSTNISTPSFTVDWTSPEGYLNVVHKHKNKLYTGGYLSPRYGNVYEYSTSYLTKPIEHGSSMDTIYDMVEYDNYLYVCGTNSTDTVGLIIRSADGIKWETVYESTTETEVLSLCEFGNYLYAGTLPNGIIIRSFTGRNWATAADIAERRIFRLATHSTYIFALTSDNTNKAGVYRSSNGTSWTKTYTCTSAMYAYRALYSWGSYIYAGFGNVSSSTRILVRSTTGASGSWSDCSTGIPAGASYIFDLCARGSYLYCGLGWSSTPLYRSSNGSSWSVVSALSTLPNRNVYGLHTNSDGRLYVGVAYSQVYYTDDDTTFTLIYDYTDFLSYGMYCVYQFFDNLYLGGQAMLKQPISRIGRLVQKMKNADYFKFYHSGGNDYDKFVLTDITILNESTMELVFYHWIIDLWRKFGYYLQGTNGFIDYTEEGISARDLVNKIVDSSCNSKFRIKYCPDIDIKIKGEWLPRHQWVYEVARLLTFALNDNSSYTQELMDSDSMSDVKVDHMNVVVENDGDIFIMPAGTVIEGSDPNYEGYYMKRITDITDNIWEADKIHVSGIDYDNAIVLDGSGTGAQRRNYLAKSIDISYTNSFTTSDKVKELSLLVAEPSFKGSVWYESTQSYLAGSGAMRLYMRIMNPNYKVDAVCGAFHPTLVINNNDCILKAQVMNTSLLAQVTDITYYKEAGFCFGGGDNQPSFYKSYRACVKEEWTASAKNYYVKLYIDGTEVASSTLTASTDIDSLDGINNYLVVKWYNDGTTGLHTIKVFFSKSSMPDPSSATPKITYNTESNLVYTHGAAGLYGLIGHTVTGTTPMQNTPTLYAYFNNLTITGETDSLWGENIITKPVIIIKDKSITTKSEARNVAITAYQNATNPKQLSIRVDPEVHMWGTTANKINVGQWVLIDGKGYYDGEYRVMWIEVTPDKMLLGLNNTKYNFTDRMEQLRSQVDKIDSFG